VGFQRFPLCEIPQRFHQLILQFESQAKVVMQSRILWSGLERALELRNGVVEIRLLQIGGSEVGSVAGIVGPEPKSCLELGDRGVR